MEREPEAEALGSFQDSVKVPAAAARSIIDALRPLGLEVRAGLHSGELETTAGNVGGIAVHIGARAAAPGGAGEVLVSSMVKDLVAGSGLLFEDRGEHELKGVPGPWHLYALAGE
jgi:class 3 adenylate cyclase